MQMSSKINCWEFKKCGREPGGINEKSLGICPVTKYKKLNNVHGGKNAGRTCWIVAGSLCKGEIQGFFAAKIKNCEKCDFFQAVCAEEYPNLKDHLQLLRIVYD
jgi:hypothetical protein